MKYKHLLIEAILIVFLLWNALQGVALQKEVQIWKAKSKAQTAQHKTILKAQMDAEAKLKTARATIVKLDAQIKDEKVYTTLGKAVLQGIKGN